MASTEKKSIVRSRDKVCKYCKKAFNSERTLAAHMCPKKRRNADKDFPSSQLGFRVYQRFYQMTTHAREPKSFNDFINSSHYNAFIKFANYLIELGPMHPDKFIDYLISNSYKMKQWHDITVYEKFLSDNIRKEPVSSALERTITEMDNWANKNGMCFTDFYENVSTTEAVYLIRSGRISPWVLYVSEKSAALLSRFNSEESKLMSNIMDVDKWSFVFHKRIDDLKYVKSIITEAGL